MKLQIAFIAILCIFIATVGIAQTVKTEIKKVIIYPDRALIKKEAKVGLAKGDNTVMFTGLPASMIDDSVQLAVKGAKVNDVRIQTTYLQKGDTTRIAGLKDKIESIKNNIATKQNDINSINSMLDYLKRISASPFAVKMTATELQAILQVLEQHTKHSYAKILKLRQSIQKLNLEKEQLEKELALLNTSQTTKLITATITNTGNSEATVILQYQTKNAGWSMGYEARVDSDSATLELQANALVYQRTGEDWNNVAIELSTAGPALATQLPQLHGWYIDMYKPYLYKRSAKAMILKNGDKAPEASTPEDIIAVEEEHTAFSFIVKGNKTIPSDGNTYTLAVAKSKTDCTLTYNTVPKLLPHVFFQGEFANPFDFPMQKGKMSIFVDNKFISIFNLDRLYPSKGLIRIALGVDENIVVQRKLVSKKTEYKGLINKTTRIEYTYTIWLQHGKKHDIAVTVQDAIPVSQNEKIVVTLLNKNSIGATIDDQGMATWYVVVLPHQKKELTIHFAVEYPENITVMGLE